MALSLAIAVNLPIAAVTAIAGGLLPDSDSALGAAATTALVAFVVVWLALWAVRRRAGTNGLAGNVMLPAVVGALLIVAAYAAIVYLWRESRGPEADFVGAEIFLVVVSAVIATYVVVYTTLSMARR